MGNIVGENFPTFVKKQVDSRQKVYGKRDRDPKDLQYLNNRTPWIKLGSSIDIERDAQKFKDLGIDDSFLGNGLAQSLVLFGGTVEEFSGVLAQNSGISRSNKFSVNTAYGFGGLEFGQAPMPGILSADTKTLNRGTIRRANVTIVAHNRKQFEAIELLYLRLGYHVLLEFGHSSYLDDDGELQTQPPTLMNSFLSGNFKDPYQVLDAIQSQKVTTRGNYDALLGKVDKFFWEFNPDGTYKISLSLVSIGDIIESLNLNTTKVIKDSDIESSVESDQSDNKVDNSTFELIEASFSSNELSRQFKKRVKKLKESDAAVTITDSVGKTIVTYKKHTFQEGQNSIFYYVRFFEFLRILEKEISFTLSNDQVSSLKFDRDIASNLMYYDPNVFTLDPRICVADYSLPFSNGKKPRYLFTQHLPIDTFDAKNFKLSVGENSYGRIMNIFLEMGFILRCLNENTTENGKVPLFNFLNAILRGVNSNFSYTTDLGLSIDETVNEVKIIEQKSLPSLQKLLKTLNKQKSQETIFDIYGYSTNLETSDIGTSFPLITEASRTSGFVKTFNFKTEISNALATTISIGAQSNGTIKGENFSAFSNWNRGLTDRIAPTKNNPLESKKNGFKTVEDIDKAIKEKQKQLNLTAKPFLEFLKLYSSPSREGFGYSSNPKGYKHKPIDRPHFYPDKIKSMLDIQKDCRELAEEIENLKQEKGILEGTISTNEISATSIDFLPLNLSLTLDGISGFKIYQSFLLRQGLLPKNYPDNLRFLIKGVSNTINSEGWTTIIDTVSIPKSTLKPTEQIFKGLEGDIERPLLDDNEVKIQPGEDPVEYKVGLSFKTKEGETLSSGTKLSKEFILSQLHPDARSIFNEFFSRIESRYLGHKILVNSIYRTYEEQAELFKKNNRNGKAGFSNHNYSTAIDFNLVLPSGKLLKKTGMKQDWLKSGIVDLAQELGIRWGDFSNYKDHVHFYVNFNKDKAIDRVLDKYQLTYGSLENPNLLTQVDPFEIKLDDLI